MALRTTYTYVEMEVSKAAHEEIKQKLIAAAYDQALHDGGATLDMHGIALVVEPQRPIAAGTLEVGNDGRNVVVNHPDLKPDENGVGHIVFSPEQAEDFSMLILKHAMKVKAEAGSGPELPDDGINVLALMSESRVNPGPWTVAYLEDGEWFEQATGDCIKVTKWMHLPAEEED